MRIIVSHPNDYYTLSRSDLEFMATVIYEYLGSDVVAEIHFRPEMDPEIVFADDVETIS